MSTKLTKKTNTKNPKETTDNACYVWDFTHPVTFSEPGEVSVTWTIEELQTILVKHCKMWTFQIEAGEKTGWKHFQGRLSLKQKMRMGALKNAFDLFSKVHLSRTSTKVAGKKASDTSFDYCLKNDTRIEGPWTDKKTFINLPLDVKMVKELRPWQETLRIMALRFELRKLDIIYCPLGNSGKSTFVRWMHCHKHGMRLPPFETYKDLGRAVSAHDFKSLYMFDLPRAMDKRKTSAFFQGLEDLKTGYCYDDRYTGTGEEKICFTPPRIFVFTNQLPNIQYLSFDRWNFWMIDENLQLVARKFYNGELYSPEEFAFIDSFKPKPHSRLRVYRNNPPAEAVPTPETPEVVPDKIIDIISETPSSTGEGGSEDPTPSFREPERPKGLRRPPTSRRLSI